jgi:Zn-dependent M28 family amino/carboxypeptidase
MLGCIVKFPNNISTNSNSSVTGVHAVAETVDVDVYKINDNATGVFSPTILEISPQVLKIQFIHRCLSLSTVIDNGIIVL